MAPSGNSWFQDILSPFWKPSPPEGTPGTVWSGKDAERGFAKGAMKSQEAGRKVRVAFRNTSKVPLILSWVAENGQPHHFYTLRPAQVQLFGVGASWACMAISSWK